MTSRTSSSHRTSSSSSSSYRSTARYSSSSSYRSDGSLGGSSDSLDPLFVSFPDSPDHSCLFGDDGPGAPSCLAPFGNHSRLSHGHSGPAGGTATGRQSSSGGAVRCLGDTYYVSADVSQFEPQDIVVMAFNHQVVVQAQKVWDDGSVGDTFTHKSLFPEDMDPLTVSGTIHCDGTLVVGVRRMAAMAGQETQGVPTYRTEAHL